MTARRTIVTPVGRLTLEADGEAVCSVRISEDEAALCGRNALLDEAVRQLEAYFAGRLRVFDLPVCMQGSEFERSVLHAMAQVPYGAAAAYGDIAAHIGRPAASRAVGRACGRNPLLILLPCHRIVGADGALTGFAAGLEVKRGLLSLEGHALTPGGRLNLKSCRHPFGQ